MSEYAGQQFVGIDLHRRRSVIVRTTAEGETLWVPGWSPTILGDLPQHPGLVFLTEANGQQVICSGTGCMVHVAYDLTALSKEGEAALDGYADPQFSEMMEKWRSLIDEMLTNREPAA